MKDDVIGHVVNVTARVAEAAAGGEVLVTGAIVRAAREDVAASGAAFGDATSTQFKGVDGRLAVCRATWHGRHPQRTYDATSENPIRS